MTVAQFIAKKTGRGKRYARTLLEAGQVLLNGTVTIEGTRGLGRFDHLSAAGEVLQATNPHYLLLHKPSGIVSATRDEIHRTVTDLVETEFAEDLHLAGRLDRFTTGLVILTNDSTFSESLTNPSQKIPKRYLVTTDQPVPETVMIKFRSGMSFDKEKIRTQPALVEMLAPHSCRLTIFEGKHHQIKRMFLRFGIRVVALHREAIGPYTLPDDLLPGQWRTFEPLACPQKE